MWRDLNPQLHDFEACALPLEPLAPGKKEMKKVSLANLKVVLSFVLAMPPLQRPKILEFGFIAF